MGDQQPPPHPSPQLRVGKGFLQKQRGVISPQTTGLMHSLCPLGQGELLFNLQTTQPLLLAALACWGGRAWHPMGVGGPWQAAGTAAL